jgi:hypothetical protein
MFLPIHASIFVWFLYFPSHQAETHEHMISSWLEVKQDGEPHYGSIHPSFS